MSRTYSVVIPTRDRREQLVLTLASLERQTVSPGRFEVIVVDYGSTDGTREALRDYAPPFSLTYLRAANERSQGAARNRGVTEASSEQIIFCDADMLTLPGFIEAFDSIVTDHSSQVVSGTPNCFRRIYTHYYAAFTPAQKRQCTAILHASGRWAEGIEHGMTNTLLTRDQLKTDARSICELTASEDIVGAERRAALEALDVAPWLLCITRCLSLKKSLLLTAGGFDPRIVRGEDWELGYRLNKLGASFEIVSDAVSLHQEHPAQSGAQHGEPFNKILFEKFGAADPEILLLALWESSDDLWLHMVAYKDAVRSLVHGKPAISPDIASVLRRACVAAAKRW